MTSATRFRTSTTIIPVLLLIIAFAAILPKQVQAKPSAPAPETLQENRETSTENQAAEEPPPPVEKPKPRQQFFTIPGQEFQQLLQRLSTGIYLIDVRESYEYRAGHIPGAINLPLSRLSVSLAEKYADKPVLLYCHSGIRSNEAYRRYFRQSNVTIVYNLEEGMIGWEKIGGELVR